MLDLVDVLLRRLAAEHDPDWVAGDRVDQHERSKRYAEDDRQGVDQPEPEESEHEGLLVQPDVLESPPGRLHRLEVLYIRVERSARRGEEERHEHGIVHDELLELPNSCSLAVSSERAASLTSCVAFSLL